MLRRWTAMAILGIAFLLLGCDVMEQDVEVHVPGSPPGEEDEETEAQNLLDENH